MPDNRFIVLVLSAPDYGNLHAVAKTGLFNSRLLPHQGLRQCFQRLHKFFHHSPTHSVEPATMTVRLITQPSITTATAVISAFPSSRTRLSPDAGSAQSPTRRPTRDRESVDRKSTRLNSSHGYIS